jgi:hypothetical protein
MNYQIKISEVLDQSWADWLSQGKMVTKHYQDGTQVTTLTLDLRHPLQ